MYKRRLTISKKTAIVLFIIAFIPVLFFASFFGKMTVSSQDALAVSASDLGYVTDGLKLCLDGINNTRSGHSSNTSTWQDLSGNNYDFTISGASITSKSLSFDGADDFAYLNNATAWTGGKESTVEIVFKATSTTKNVILFQDPQSYNAFGIGNDNRGIIHGSSDNYQKQLISDRPIFAWSKLLSYSVAYYDYTSTSAFVCYADGVRQDGRGSNNSWSYGTSNYKCIGCRDYTSGYDRYFYKGEIYAIRVYNRALTEAEQLRNYNLDVKRFESQNRTDQGYVKDGLVLQLDGIVNTRSGHNNNATTWEDISGSGTNYDFDMHNCSVSEDGVTFNGISSDNIEPSYAYCNNTTNLAGSSGLTMEVVYVSDSLPTDSCMVYSDGSSNVCVSNYYSGSEKWLILAMNLSYTKYSLLNSKSSVPNVFHNVSVSYTSVTANNQFIADVDGSPYETLTSGTHYHTPISGYTGKILGAIEGNKNQSNMAFFGKIYAVRIYNRSLTAGERRMNYERDVERFSLSTEDELGYAKDGMRLWLDGEKNTRAGHSASTSTWEDLSGYGYDFTMSNCSIGDRYFGFNGSSSCGQRASAPNLAAGETLTLEITLLCNLPASTYQIVFMDNVSCAGLGWTSMTSVITAAAPSGGKTRDISNNTGFEVSKLLTYSITYTGSGSNNYNLYINNTLCSKGSGTDQWNRTNTTNMWIGRRGEGESGNQYWFNGNIYAIRIYNRTLTNYERTMNYQLDRERFLPQSTDVGYVKDGMTLWLDGEHNTREGHSTSSSTWQNLAPTGSAYDYTLYNCTFGTNNIGFNNTGYGKCTNTGYLSGARSNTATLEIVLYGNGKNGSQIVFRDVDSHIGFGSTTSTLIFSASNGDTYAKRIASGAVASGAVTLYSIAYNDVITKNTADFSVKVNNSNLALAGSGNDYWGIRSGKAYKTVGAREESEDFDGFNGSIYCVRVYNRVLSDEERYQNYLVDQKRFFGSTVYDVEEDIDGVSLSGQKLAQANTAYSAKLVAGDSVLPSELVVKAGNTTLTSGTHYTYNSSTGALTINASSVTGKIKICAKRSVVFPTAQTGYTIYNDSGTAVSGTKTIGSEYGVRFKVTANTASGYAVTKVTAGGKELIAKNGYYYIDKYTSAPTIAVTTCNILKLESITPVNNQYYNTGVEPNDHTGGKVTFMSTATGNTIDDNVLSSRNYDDGQHPANRFYVPYMYTNEYKWVYGNNRLAYINQTSGTLNASYTVSLNYNDDHKAVVAGGSSADLPDKHFNINRYGLYIANFNCGGGPIADSNLIGRIYEVYITQNSTVTHHYIPVLDSNNSACLYDVENNVFLYHGGGSTMGFRLFVTVTLDNANATASGTSSVSALYGSAMPSITVPTRTGYNFSGYYNATSGGVKYYNANGSSAKNWDVIAKTATLNTQWTLSPISVSSQPSAINKTYDGNNSTLTYTVSHALTKTYQWYKGGAPISGATAASLTVKNVSDSGSYYCVATVTDSGNTVTSTSNTVTVTVGQKELTFNAISTGGSYVYNGQDAWENRAACSVSGMVGSETLKVLVSRQVGTYLTGYDFPTTQEWTQNGIACGQYGTRASGAALYFSAKNVGSWSIAVVGVDSGSGNVNNYKWATNSDTDAERTVTFTVTAKEVTLSWGTASFIYDGGSHKPTCAAGALCSGDSCVVTVIGEQVNAGEYTATASALSNGNYKLPSGKTKAFEITQKEVTLSWGTASFIYDGGSHKPTCAAGALCSGDSCTVTVTGEQTNAGDYTATASALSNGNYKLPSEKTKAFEIAQKEVTLSWGTASFIYDGGSHKPTCAAGDLCSGDSCVVTVIGEQVNAGEYTATASALSNGNYKLPSGKTKAFEIAQKEVTLSWGETSFVYDKVSHAPTCAAANVCEGDTCVVTVIGEQVNVGEYTATASSLSNGNYKLPSVKTRAFGITQKEVTLSWGETSFVYDKISHAPTCAAANVCEGDTCVVTVIGEQVNVGDYIATVSVLSNGNYKLPSANTKAFEITPKEIGLSWSGVSLIYNGNAQAPSCVATGVCEGDECVVTVTGAQTDRSEFAYTATASIDNDNYKLPSIASTSFEIAAKDISGATIVLDELDLVYNGGAQTQTVASVTIDGLSATFTVSDNEATNAGDYVLTVTGTGNYCGSETADYSVEKKEATLLWTAPVDLIYSASVKTPTVVVSNLETGDECAVEYALTDGCDNVNVGLFTFTASALDNDNYKLPTSPVSPEYEIVRKDISGAEIVLGAALTYNGQEQTKEVVSVTIDGLTVTCIVSNNTAENAGDYVLTVTGAGNYCGSETADYSVLKKEAALLWTAPGDLIYSASVKTPTVVVSNLETGDECAVASALTDGKDNVNVGFFTFTATALDNDNYKLPPIVVSPEYEIVRKDISGAEIALGSPNTYNGQNRTQTVTSVTIDGLSATYEVSGNVRREAGDYILTVTGTGNYCGAETKEYSVLRLSIANATVVLGENLTYDGTDQTQAISSVTIDDLVVTYEVSGDVACRAGDYSLTLTGTGNYIGDKVVGYTVAKKTLTVKANDNAIVYGDAPAGNGVSYTGLVAGDELIGTLDYDYTYSTYGAIGTYALTPKGLTSGDYEITFAAGVLTVNKKPVSAVLHAENVTYGSVVEASAEFVEGSIVNNDNVPILLSYTGVLDSGEIYEENTEKPTKAGTYILWAKLSDEGDSYNYSMTQSVQFSIAKADYQVSDMFSFSDAEFYYDGTEHFLRVVKKEQNDIVVTYENNGRTAVGSQTVVAKFSGYDENNYNTIADMEATLTILARSISGAEIALSDSLTYNGEEQTQLVSSVCLTVTIAGEPVVLNVPEYVVSSNTGTNAGDYALTVTASGNFSGSQTAAFSIAKKNISGAEIVLGARNVYNGREQTQTVTSVTVDGLIVDIFYLSGNVQTDVGASDYVLTVTAGGQNFTGSATKGWNIDRKDVTDATITLGASLVYNGAEQTQDISSVEIDGLSATFDVSGNTETAAGDYVLTVTGTGNFRGEAQADYGIAKKALTISAANYGIVYGDEPTNGGVIYDGFVGGEDESDLGGEAQYAYSYVRYGNIGNYTITVSGFTSDNYEISYQQGVLTVERYEVTLDWDQSVIRYTGSIRYPSATVATLNGDECTVTVTGGGTTAGRYTAEAVSLSNGNYVLPAETTIEFDVLPALIDPPLPSTETYVYTGEEIAYRFGTDTEPTYTVVGNRRTESGTQSVVLTIRDKTNYCWSDTETTDDKEYTFTVEKRRIDRPVPEEKPYSGRVQTATIPESSYYRDTVNDGGTDVGTYDVVLELIDDNCAWTGTDERQITVAFSIVRATNIWSIRPYANDGVYGAAFMPASGAARFGQITIGYRLRSATDDVYSSVVPTNAGEYYALVSVEGTNNYTELSERLSFTIDKATFDTSKFGWDYEEPFTYDGSEKRINVVGLPSGVRATVSGNVKTDAGEYTATAELIYDSDNYNEISLDPCVWVIEAQSISATWTMATYTYSGSEFALPTARYYGRGFQIDLHVEERDGKTFLGAGEYVFVASSPNANYVVEENETQSFTIKKRRIVVPAENETEFFCTGEEQTYSIAESAFYTVKENTRTEAGSQNARVVLNDKDNTEWATGSSEDLLFAFVIKHRFSEHNGADDKIVKEATCTESAVYYAECVCGEREEYSFGDPLGHEYRVEFFWHEGYTATAYISCGRCDHTAEAEAEITNTKEDYVEFYHASITLGGKTFTDSMRKGAAVYRDHVYADPVWTWNWTGAGYETDVVFNACDGSDLTQELTAEVTLTESSDSLSFVAVVYFGDTNKKFTDEKTVNKVHFTVHWTEDNAYAAYVWPDRSVSEFLRNAPAQDGYTLYAFRTDEGVYLPNTEACLSDFKTKGSSMALTALWQGRGSLVLIAENEDNALLEEVFFSLQQNGTSLFEGSTDHTGKVTFGKVPYGAYNLVASFALSGKQITRSYSVTVSHAQEERTIVLEQSRVSTEINGPISAENLEETLSERERNASVTLVLDTSEKPSEERQGAMTIKAENENKGHTLIDFFDLTVTEKIKTVDENGSVSEQSMILGSSETPIVLRMPLSDEIYSRLIDRNGSLDDVIVYVCGEDGVSIGKLPKKDFARDSEEYYYVETSGSEPYVVLSANRFVSYAIGIQNTVVQAINDFIDLAIENWVYGKSANLPRSSVRYGTVKYLYAAKGDNVYSEFAPTKAGTYLLKAYVEAEEEYSAAEKVIEFTVEKATYNMRGISFGDLYVIADGSQHTVEIRGELPEGVTVVYEGNVQSETGEYVAVAHFYGDSENYNVISDKTANIVIHDQKQLILKRYWWAFAVAGAFLLISLLVPIFRPKGKRGGLMFNYRIGG